MSMKFFTFEFVHLYKQEPSAFMQHR